jgi:hypothetical protein
MMKACSIGLLGDQHALCGIHVEFAEELVLARLERPDRDDDLALAGDDLFAIEAIALELLGCGVLVLDHQLDLLASGNLEFGGHEAVILDDQFELDRVGREARGGGE